MSGRHAAEVDGAPRRRAGRARLGPRASTRSAWLRRSSCGRPSSVLTPSGVKTGRRYLTPSGVKARHSAPGASIGSATHVRLRPLGSTRALAPCRVVTESGAVSPGRVQSLEIIGGCPRGRGKRKRRSGQSTQTRRCLSLPNIIRVFITSKGVVIAAAIAPPKEPHAAACIGDASSFFRYCASSTLDLS